MGSMRAAIRRRWERARRRREDRRDLSARVDAALREERALFASPQAFVDPLAETAWRVRNRAALSAAEATGFRRLARCPLGRAADQRRRLREAAASLPRRILRHNERVADLRAPAAYALIGKVEGRRLDRQQMSCVVRESRNQLVLAGAGTGKTTTVVAKVKYLLRTGQCRPQEILVLSFTNASASEMSGRVAAEAGPGVAALTFHKLGLRIIASVNGVMPRIARFDLRGFIRERLERNARDPSYLALLASYLLYHRVVPRSEFGFSSQREYDEYLRLNPPVTVNHEVVKSYGEMDIANFLTQNGVRYVYEPPYEVDTRTSAYGQYHPDFYLPDDRIYIEYFGINRKGETPPYFEARDGMTASEAYRASMEWKRALHRRHHTVMVECYAYEKAEGRLLEALQGRLEALSVPLKPQAPEELWARAAAGAGSPSAALDGIAELFETLINLIKSNGYGIADVRRLNRAEGGLHARANGLLLTLLEPIFRAYCQRLADRNEIDFNDMINLAAEYVEQGRYVNPYRYVIVDEYQDISKARFRLLNCLRKSRDYGLFCVGDDWQSIYRFAGSDIGFILNFSRYWGAAEVCRIQTSYRFPQKLIEISGAFVMRNPAQVRKSIRGRVGDPGFPLGEISGYTDRKAVEFMAERLADLPRGSSVFLIGRYSFDVELLSGSGLFSCRYDPASGFVEVRAAARSDLKMTFLTAHRSKGLQADYVFIINNRNARMGFPSQIQDAPILELLLNDCDRYPRAEERRLFYVALTRAKRKAFFLTVQGQESEFALELRERYASELKRERFECPLCGGRLVRRSGPYGTFLGCSNYRATGCGYRRNIR